MNTTPTDGKFDRFAWLNAMYDSDLAPVSKSAAAFLMSKADASGNAWPAQATIAAKISRGLSTVKVALRELEDAGWLVTSNRTGTSSTYQLTIGGSQSPATPSQPVATPSQSQATPLASHGLGGSQPLARGWPATGYKQTNEQTNEQTTSVGGEIYDRLRTQIETHGRPEVPKPLRMHPEQFLTLWRTASRGVRWVKTSHGDLMLAILVFWAPREIEKAMAAVRDWRECKYPVTKLTDELTAMAAVGAVAPTQNRVVTADDMAAWELT